MYRITPLILVFFTYCQTNLFSQTYLEDLQFVENDIKELIAVNYLIFNNDLEGFQEFIYEYDYQPLNEDDGPYIQMVKFPFENNESREFNRELQPFMQIYLDGASGESNISLFYTLNKKLNLPFNVTSNLHNHIIDLFNNSKLCLKAKSGATGATKSEAEYECETFFSNMLQEVYDHYINDDDYNVSMKERNVIGPNFRSYTQKDHIIIDSVNPNKKSKIIIASNFLSVDLGDGKSTIVYRGPVNNVTSLQLDSQEQDDGTFYYKILINSFAHEGNPNTDFNYKEFMQIKGLNDIFW